MHTGSPIPLSQFHDALELMSKEAFNFIALGLMRITARP